MAKKTRLTLSFNVQLDSRVRPNGGGQGPGLQSRKRAEIRGIASRKTPNPPPPWTGSAVANAQRPISNPGANAARRASLIPETISDRTSWRVFGNVGHSAAHRTWDRAGG